MFADRSAQGRTEPGPFGLLQRKIAGPGRQDTHPGPRCSGGARRWHGQVVAPHENLARGAGAFVSTRERHRRASGQTADADDHHDGRDRAQRASERGVSSHDATNDTPRQGHPAADPFR